MIFVGLFVGGNSKEKSRNSKNDTKMKVFIKQNCLVQISRKADGKQET